MLLGLLLRDHQAVQLAHVAGGDHLVEEVPPRAAVTGEGDAWEEWLLASDEVADKVRLFCASSSK